MKRLMLLLAFLMTLVSPASAFAVRPNDPTGGSTPALIDDQHVDRSMILWGGLRYYDDKIDNDYTYKAPADSNGCVSTITHLTNGNTNAKLTTYSYDKTSGQCNSHSTTITLGDPAASKWPLIFTSADGQHLATSDGRTTYTWDNGLQEFLEDGGDRCKDILKIVRPAGEGQSAQISVLARTNGSSTSYDSWADELNFPSSYHYDSVGKCNVYGPKTYGANAFILMNDESYSGVVNGTGGNATGSGPSQSAATDVCSSNSQSFSWMICPAITVIQSSLNTTFQNIIKPALQIEPIMGDPQLKAVWRSFVGVADILFVVAFLMVIFGIALRLNIDAYTIKKSLPKLIAAAVFVQFSFFICAFVIDIGNLLGVGILQLVGQTVHSVSTSGSGVGAKDIGFAIAGGMLTVAAGVGAAILIGPTLLVLLVGLLISALTFLVTLAVRKLLIITFVILSPIAFVAWILPNTENWFKRWYQNFFKVVMIYPIVALLLSVGYIIQAAANTKNGFGGLIAILAPTIAFFMMPMAFKWGGGVMSMAQGAINSRGGKLRGAATKGTQSALDNSAYLKNRQAQKRAGWINQAQGNGFGARYAQRRLGMGWKSTPLAANQINAMAAKEEGERLSGAGRQIRDLDRADVRKLAAGEAISIMGADGKPRIIQPTEDLQRASIDKLAQMRDTDGLETVQTALNSAGRGDLYDSAIRSSSAFGAIFERAPHVASSKFDYSGTTSAAMSEFNATAMRKLLSDPTVTQEKKLELFGNLDFRQRGLVRSRFNEELLTDKESGQSYFSEFESLLKDTDPKSAGTPTPAGPGGAPIIVDEDGDAHA